jgi:enterochelin esterase-like enzyme
MKVSAILVERKVINSRKLHREVKVDFYSLRNVLDPSSMNLLLINDGQDLENMAFSEMLEDLNESGKLEPLFCVGIHAGKDRRMEYGTAHQADYKGRGVLAGLYTRFVIEELLPYISKEYLIPVFKEKAIAGFSLGGLTALDIAWNNPYEFSRVAVFSGSLWWRTKALDDGYVEERDRIMHKAIREGKYFPGLKFFFQAGVLDETRDRNNNGVIDSIDDTVSVIDELVKKGYNRDEIMYLQYQDGKHDVPTWGRAMPEFLTWAYGR